MEVIIRRVFIDLFLGEFRRFAEVRLHYDAMKLNFNLIYFQLWLRMLAAAQTSYQTASETAEATTFTTLAATATTLIASTQSLHTTLANSKDKETTRATITHISISRRVSDEMLIAHTIFTNVTTTFTRRCTSMVTDTN